MTTAASSNGKTPGFDPVDAGSIPAAAAMPDHVCGEAGWRFDFPRGRVICRVCEPERRS